MLRRPRKTTENSWCGSQDSNSALPEYNSDAVSLEASYLIDISVRLEMWNSPHADHVRLPNCCREPRTARRGPCGAVTRPDSRHAERVLCCATQSKIRQAAVTVALCRQPEQTEFGGAVLQEDRGGCAHRTTPWGHGQIGLGIEPPNAANRDKNTSLFGSKWNVC